MASTIIDDNIEIVNNLPEPRVRRLMVEYFNSVGLVMPFRHTHLQYELLFIKKGSVSIENNGVRMDVKGPCLVVHKPFTLHRAVVPPDEKYERFVANFDDSLLQNFKNWIPDLTTITENASTVILLRNDILGKVVELFTELCECSENELDARGEILLIYLLNLVTDYAGTAETCPKQIECAYVARAMDYIGKHFGENILIEDLAKKLFVSRAKFISDFKNYTGITVKQYIQLTRINYAKLMLVSGSSITETAQRCGFCDDSHFVYTFRKVVGMTPRAYSLNPALADS